MATNLAIPINGINRNDTFIKSAMDDLQDPLFLTFKLDFFPERESFPKGDGLYSSSLLKQPGVFDAVDKGRDQGGTVEYSTQDWLQQYYGTDYLSENIKQGHPNPYLALYKFREGLRVLQDMPWYFQSITGVGDLWKSAHTGITDGYKKLTSGGLTINCLESVMQPLTDLAENYRYAMYDQDRLSYRVPENLRWFDLVIDLVEIREIVDRGGNIFKTDRKGNVLEGIKVIQFRCKMCEFDFSDFLSPVGVSDFYSYTSDKPFYPSFKIKVGWVNQEEVSLQDAADLKTVGTFSALSNIVGNRINKFIQGAGRLPGQLIGSVLNPLTSGLVGNVFGNAYEGVASDLKNIPTRIRPGVRPIADRPIPYDTAILAGFADAYPDSLEEAGIIKRGPPNRFNPNPPPQNIYDAEILAGTADVYPNSNREPVIGPPTGNAYSKLTEPAAGPPIGNAYSSLTVTAAGPPTGTVYPNQTEPVAGPPTGDVYPNRTEPVAGPPTGDVYPNRTEPVAGPPTGTVYST
jgi:hypothetical protein